MDLHENWDEVRDFFHDSFKSSFHYAIATVSDKGEPHVIPIGSQILGSPGVGFYFEKFPQNLPRNLGHSNRVCVLAVNSGRWFWLRSLIGGRFPKPPAVRLYGITGELRAASMREIALWQRRVKRVSFSKGHGLMWREMNMVREIQFTRIEPVHIGKMTLGNW